MAPSSSKPLLVLALLLAGAFLVASADNEQQTQAKTAAEESKAEVQDDWRGGGPGGRYPGGGYPGGHSGGYPGGHGGGYPGGRCRWGCCGGRGYYGGCRYCCSRPDEIPESVEVHN